MTLTADTLPDSAPLPRDLLEQVREKRAIAEAAETAILQLGVEWAVANPVLPGQEAWRPTPEQLHPCDLVELDPAIQAALSEDDITWAGIPEVAWDAPAAFAAANGMTTAAGKAVMRDGLVLAFRAPRTWALLDKMRGTARQARRVAEALLSQPDDVCAYVDAEVSARIAGGRTVGTVVLDRLVDEAMLRLHAEDRELEQLDALDRTHVTVDPTAINHTGIGSLEARADWADLAASDASAASKRRSSRRSRSDRLETR